MPNLSQLQGALERLSQAIAPLNSIVAERVRSDLAAALFHLSRRPEDRPIVAIIGGTGTGKSTIVNRLLEADLNATSFRRTFTAGPVAITRDEVPSTFAALPHLPPGELPARGQTDRLTIVRSDKPLLNHLTLIDTPDIDGELPEHHQLADRTFRWCDAVLFLVSPEKYQMPELQPYYRLAQRYGLPSLHVMNKADEAEVVEDYQRLLARSGIDNAAVLTVPRDDSTWQPPAETVLTADRLKNLRVAPSDAGRRARIADVLGRVNDQLLQPMLSARRDANRAAAAVATLAGGGVELDVHPLTQQLQRRMRERSVLYLMGPQRMLDRVRSVPTMLVRLPRTMWDWTRTGEFKIPGVTETDAKAESPDFREIVVEQFQSLQSRIDDFIRAAPGLSAVSADWKLPTESASAIVDEELSVLKQWLETRWNATPRDTAILQKLLKVIPGAQRLSKYSEAAPYLLAIACVAHGAVFGHLDLMILGGYSALTWLTERISDEVAGKTRTTNAAIATRYGELATQQIERAVAHLEKQAPPQRVLDQASRALEEARGLIS